MGKSTPSAPAAPDPNAVASAQTASNKDTALYNFGLNNPTVNTPMGSSSFTINNSTPTYNMDAYNQALQAWQQAGGNSQGSQNGQTVNGQLMQSSNPEAPGYIVPGTDSSGNAGAMPTLAQYMTNSGGNPTATQNITLAPDQQQLYNQQTQQSIGLSNLANQLMPTVGNALSQSLPTYSSLQDASKQAQDAYYNSQMAYLQPQQATSKEQLDNQLANQGIMAGSDAYNTAQDAMARQNTFSNQQAMNNAILQGPQNAQALFGLDVSALNQPLNELNALRTGSQVSMPTASGVNPSSAQPTNVAGITQQGYQNSLNGYNQQIASNNNTTNGLFGLGGNALMAAAMFA